MKKQYWSLLALAAVVLLTVGGFASCSNDDDDDSDSGSTSSSTSVELSASVGTNELAGLTLTRVFRIYYGDGLSGGRGYIKYVFSDTEMGYYYMETAEDAELSRLTTRFIKSFISFCVASSPAICSSCVLEEDEILLKAPSQTLLSEPRILDFKADKSVQKSPTALFACSM